MQPNCVWERGERETPETREGSLQTVLLVTKSTPEIAIKSDQAQIPTIFLAVSAGMAAPVCLPFTPKSWKF